MRQQLNVKSHVTNPSIPCTILSHNRNHRCRVYNSTTLQLYNSTIVMLVIKIHAAYSTERVNSITCNFISQFKPRAKFDFHFGWSGKSADNTFHAVEKHYFYMISSTKKTSHFHRSTIFEQTLSRFDDVDARVGQKYVLSSSCGIIRSLFYLTRSVLL